LNRLGPFVALAAACLTTGWAAARVGDPPPGWPPAGVAVAGLLVGGRRLWPAVAVGVGGAALVEGRAAGLAAVAGLAAAGQAVAGAWLVRRAVGPAAPLRPRDVALFLLLAGPAPAVLAPTADAVARSTAADWPARWRAEAVGGAAFAPLALALIGSPGWDRRRLTVALPLALAAGLAAGGAAAARRTDAANADARLQADADRAAAALRTDLDHLLAGMDEVRPADDLSDLVRSRSGREALGNDLRLLRAACPTARAVSVNVLVTGGELDAFEDAVRSAGPARFKVTEYAADGGRVPAARRDRHLVIALIDPQDGNDQALGFDMLADPMRAALFDRAVAAGEPVGSPPMRLAQGVNGFMVVRPFYWPTRPSTPEGRRAAVRGALVAGFDRAAVPAVVRDPRLAVTLAHPGSEPPPAVPPGGAAASARIEIGGREWAVWVTADAAAAAARRTGYADVAAGAGGTAVGLLAALLLAVTGQTARVAAAVAARTAELSDALAAAGLTGAALRASEGRLAEAQRLAGVGWWEWDPVTGTGHGSAEVAAVLGLPADAPATTAAFLDRLHPDDRPGFADAVRRVLAARDRDEREVRVVRPDGTERWAACGMTASADDPVFLLGTLQDVTARKLAEVDARQAAARLDEAQRIARVGSFDWRPATGEAWWSEQMYRLYARDPAAGPPPPDEFEGAIHPDDRATARAKFHGLVAAGTHDVWEFRVRAGGGETHVRADVAVERDAAGRPARVTGTHQDVTDRVRAEAERRRLDDRLREAERLESLGVLAGGVAHDFNNLMTGVLGNAGLLRELLPPDSDWHEFLVPIEKAAAHAGALCQQMLAYAGRGATRRGPVDLNRLVADSVALVRMAAGPAADVRYAPAAGRPTLEADESQVRQVLLNLVTNAAEAVGPAGGRIDVRTGASDAADCPLPGPGHRCGGLPPGRYAWLEVRDTGHGMSAETMARIFDPFYSTKFPGRGLGLSAVHGIARGHGGCVCVSSREGEGTTFRVYFAAAGGGPPRTPPPASVTPPADRRAVL
jgi:signal transduction histidine kinase/CHASE1-domain containing sensor protein